MGSLTALHTSWPYFCFHAKIDNTAIVICIAFWGNVYPFTMPEPQGQNDHDWRKIN